MALIPLVGESLPPQFGTGRDGDIIIRSGYTISIKDLYENENVTGVTTKFGDDKGLNYGSGIYDPENSTFIHSSNFTIESGSTLTTSVWNQQYGPEILRDDRSGIIWISCIANFINQGDITLYKLGGSGGAGWWTAHGYTGSGYGGGDGNGLWNAVPGGIQYGTQDISYSNWQYLYGSGGGATRVMNYNGAAGGDGGGALRIYAIAQIDASQGTINCNGETGFNGATTGSVDNGCNGGGGGGAGGTIYLESLGGTTIGSSNIVAIGGNGGVGGGPGSSYPNHGGGGGGGGNSTTGTDGGAQHSARFAGNGGAGAAGRIAIRGPVSGDITDPNYYHITT